IRSLLFMAIKVFKSATNKSIMDIKSMLNYYQTKGEEEVYKGKMSITINEFGGSKQQLSAFVDKAKMKMILAFIIDHHFSKKVPDGLIDYGVTVKTKRARNLFIKFDKDKQRYMFKIDEGEGKITGTGAIQMIKKETTVMTFLTYEDTIMMAHEVLDFIRQAELTAMMKGKPLYTIIPEFKPNQ